ncbi:dihydrofolate reductase family protein [Oricola sp.]|uniref:dihydrofolate reductase family protein n=1 Tax=Oricola sp. TaxID=1979950 RepID=UPI000C8CF88E|nr:deaminase [Ahrensia sp.]|tara:strand:- start:29150 stop:29677 length:528 start_codon:yes stop_codon:yes gene_type:complete
MAKLVFGMNVSLDGYVDFDKFAPGPTLFRHWIESTRGLAGSLYGRKLYEIMRYWEQNDPEWTAAERDFAEAWLAMPKWVASHTLTSVGPNATLIRELESEVRVLKEEIAGEIDVGGPSLAQSLGETGLIDEYRLYFHPVVLGGGDPFFRSALPPLRFVSSNMVGDGVIRLIYVPA